MQLTFNSPSCGKAYGLPWSMAGKRARCHRCSNEFVVPAPYEPTAPGSSEAIPVVDPSEPPRSAEAIPVHGGVETSRVAPSFQTTRIEVPPPEPPARRPASPPTARIEVPPPRKAESSAPPWPHHVKPREPAPAPVPAPIAPTHRPPKPSRSPAARPAWLIPAIAGGGAALVLAINLGFYLAFVSGRKGADPVESNPAEVAGALANSPIENARSEVASPAPVASPTVAARPPAAPEKAPSVAPPPLAEVVPDRVMNTAEIVQRYESSVALIKGKKGSGTGFIARPGIIATNSHVIDGERVKDLEVRFPSAPEKQQGPYPAKVIYQDKDRDLALLRVATDLAPVRVAEKYKFRKGEDVTVIGNPGVGGQMILENAISRGIVSSMTKINQHSFLQLGIAINPGNSGGPVFDPKGRVIGVVTLKTTQQEGLAFAVPAEDLLSALETAESIDTSKGPDEPGRSAPPLAYAFKRGQTYVYSLEMSIETANGRVTLAGNSIYRIKAVDADGITIGHRGSLTTTKRGKDGKTLPGGVIGPEQTKEVELKIDDRGFVLSSSGSTTLPLLGDFAMLMIEPLPDDPSPTWEDSQTLTLREVEQIPGAAAVGPKLGRPGLDNMPQTPRARPSSRARAGSRPAARPPTPSPPQPKPQVRVTLHEAKEETNYTLGAQVGDRAPIRKVYEMATTEMVGNSPLLKMSGDGTIHFDVKLGIPVAMNYKLMVVEVAGNGSVKIPITVSCKLLEGRER
jgi:S1-C subfamily serine protease